MVSLLNNDLLFMEIFDPEEAKWVLEAGRRWFRGGSLQIDWWSPKSGCVKKKNMAKEVRMRVVGLPLHLWTVETLRRIGDSRGGFVDVYQDTTLRTITM